MRRILFRLAVTLLTFATGVAVAALWPPVQMRHSSPNTRPVQIHQAALKPAEQFSRVGVMHSLSMNHGCVKSETYRTANGSYLTFSWSDYGSTAQAARQWQREIKEAERVIERTTVTDEAGRRIGERVFLQGGADEKAASVRWTRESESFSIRADSVEHALEFERWYQDAP